VTLLPHQLEPALAILDGARRVLIADDVGLGKTIQAGLISAELQRRYAAARVLVIAPASLHAQWTAELTERFHLDATSADRDRIDQIGAALPRGMNPWVQQSVWIASLDYLKQPHVLDALPLAPWDLVVIDEAHLACGPSDRHDAACLIAARARHVVLLTATPDSGRSRDRAALQRIGALAGVEDPLVVFRRTRRDLGWPASRRVRLHHVALSPAECRLLDALRDFEQAALRAAGPSNRDATLLLLSVFRKRALSTVAAFGISINRRLAYLRDDPTVAAWLQPSLDFEGGADDLSEDERAGLAVTLGLDAAHERTWLRRLKTLADLAASRESKVRRVMAIIGRTREAVIIFTEFRDSLEVVRSHVTRVTPAAAVHGGLSVSDQRREIERFLRGDVRVLIATDVASQGLNLQSRARWVVSLDLPWNPVRLEQRAGRVDRIGQTRSVHVTLLAARHAAEDALLSRLARRVLDAQRALPDGDLLRGALPDERHLRALFIAGLPLADDATDRAQAVEPLVHCRRWARPAARVVSIFQSRRRFLSAGPVGPAGPGGHGGLVGPAGPARPLRVSARRLPRLAGGPSGSLCVFSVPIIDRSGATIERHAVAVRIAAMEGNAGTAGVSRIQLDAAREAAARALDARARRVAHAARLRLERETTRERAAAGAVALGARDAGQAQPGLFDRRAARRQEEARALAEQLTAGLARRIESLTDGTVVSVGQPRIEIVVTDDGPRARRTTGGHVRPGAREDARR
jgi:superfamily II DNA or RNA helicase